MATIDSYKTSAGTRYRVRYRKPDGKQTAKRGFVRKRDATEFLQSIEVQKRTAEFVAASAGRVTVAELSSPWLARKTATVSRSWGYSLDVAMRTHVLPRWGDTSVSRIDQLAVETWVAELGSRRSATVTKRALGILQGVLDDAVKGKHLARNPARGVERLPKRAPKKHVYLNFEDVDALARCMFDTGQCTHRLRARAVRSPLGRADCPSPV